LKSAYDDKERLISYMLLGGVGAFLAGLFFTFLAIVFQSSALFGLGPFLLLVGMVSVGTALYLGHSHNKSVASSASLPPAEGRITARFAVNDIGEMIFDNYDYDAEDARYYVKVHFLGGRRDEFECARPVFDQCGEGMRGLLTVQGGWLSMFTPLPDTDETRAAYRDW
jgi:hypothetical protein